MSYEIPAYYSGLVSFRRVFGRGYPVLIYHKLGPRPGGVRLKGLYLGKALFTRQLEELRRAGFTTGSLSDCTTKPPSKQVVITFDDGYVNALRHGLGPLAVTQFKAVQFLTADLLGKRNEWDVPLGETPEPMMDQAQVQEWLAAGHEIGSHTLTHPYLTQLPRSRAREEITASRKKLEDIFSRVIEHFCYPYGDWNEAVRDMVMEAGYRTACTTTPGVNTTADSPFALKRFTARYPSRRLKAIWGRMRTWMHEEA
jgi:peptidoglycan/xylan/chitin deacetylase (PgdA/CDA1 family)